MMTKRSGKMDCPPWMARVLRAAAVYNLVWGAWVVLMPASSLAFLGLTDLSVQAHALWQSVGMIVGVYGIGYWVAAADPVKHWPIVLVGLLGKVLGPIGFVDAVFIKDVLPLRMGLTILTNDLAWWVPFGLLLVHARRAHKQSGANAGEVARDE